MTSTALPELLRGRRPEQVALIVPDLVQGVATWSELGGFDQWRVYSYHPGNTEGMSYRGAEGDFEMRLAFTPGPTAENRAPQFELVQAVAGRSIYSEWVERHGYGLHHLGFYVPSIAQAMDAMRAEGHEPIQTGFGYGLDGDGGFAYYELDALPGLVVELIEVPARRREPEAL